MTEVQLHIRGYPGGDSEERADLAWDLQEELSSYGVEDVSRPSAEPMSGAKGSAFEWAQLVVTVVGGLPPLLGMLRGWLSRHPGASISVEIDGDSITLDDATTSERQELIAAWMESQEVLSVHP